MAKVILKWRYIKPGTKKHNSNLVKYIAQRHNVDKIDDTWQALPVSESQQNLINQILKDFPETADSHEYQDYSCFVFVSHESGIWLCPRKLDFGGDSAFCVYGHHAR